MRSTREIKGHGAKVPNQVASQRASAACDPRGKSWDMAQGPEPGREPASVCCMWSTRGIKGSRTRSRASERLLRVVHEGDQGTWRKVPNQGASQRASAACGPRGGSRDMAPDPEPGREPASVCCMRSTRGIKGHGARSRTRSRAGIKEHGARSRTRSRANERLLHAVHEGDQGTWCQIPNAVASQRASAACGPRGESRDMVQRPEPGREPASVCCMWSTRGIKGHGARSRTRSRASERLLHVVHEGDQGTRCKVPNQVASQRASAACGPRGGSRDMVQGPEPGREPASVCCMRSTREIKGHGARSRTRSRASERLLHVVHEGDQGTWCKVPNEVASQRASATCGPRGGSRDMVQGTEPVASQRASAACGPRGGSRDMAPDPELGREPASVCCMWSTRRIKGHGARSRTRSRASERLLPAVHEGDQGTWRQGSEPWGSPSRVTMHHTDQAPGQTAKRSCNDSSPGTRSLQGALTMPRPLEREHSTRVRSKSRQTQRCREARQGSKDQGRGHLIQHFAAEESSIPQSPIAQDSRSEQMSTQLRPLSRGENNLDCFFPSCTRACQRGGHRNDPKEDEELLKMASATKVTSVAATLHFVGVDRSDVQNAANNMPNWRSDRREICDRLDEGDMGDAGMGRRRVQHRLSLRGRQAPRGSRRVVG